MSLGCQHHPLQPHRSHLQAPFPTSLMSPITAAHSTPCHGHPSLRPFSLYPLPSVAFIQSCWEALNQGPAWGPNPEGQSSQPQAVHGRMLVWHWLQMTLLTALTSTPHLQLPLHPQGMETLQPPPQPLGLSGRQLLKPQPPSFPTAPPLSGKHEPPKSLPPNFSPIRVGGYILPGPPDPGCYSHSSLSRSPGELCLSHPGQLRVWH